MSLMEDSYVWAKRPTFALRSTSGISRPSRMKHTWAGPIDPQLYSDSLTRLTKDTEYNIARLDMARQRPLSADNKTLGSFKESDTFKAPWHDTTVMFAPRGALNVPTPRTDDDAASTMSTSAGAFNFCYLCSTLEEHKQHMLKTRFPKKPAEMRKPRIQYIAPKPHVRRKMDERILDVFDSRYKIVVWTGDKPGATTDANVFVTIKGDENVLHKTRLSHGNNNMKVCFCRGSKETFYVKSPFLGNLEILSIKHDGLEKRHSWYCDKVEVTCMRTRRHWVFVCDNWLSMHHGDFMVRRDLMANYMEKKLKEFEITVVTGKKRLAGTDANVYVTFYGTEGNSPKIKLPADASRKPFQRKSVDKFIIRFGDIGDIRNMRIEHDGKGLASGWFLDRVIVQNVKDPRVIYYFLLNGWLAKDVGDGHLWRELRAKKKLTKEITTGKPVSYQVTVRTGDVKYAGTDANVYVIIEGKKGKTKKLFMDDSRDNFERGMTEVFELTAMNTGLINRINIGHDNSGPGAGWYCEDITIKKYLTKEEVAEFLSTLKKKRKPKDKRKKKLSEKLRERHLDMVQEEDEEGWEDEDEEDPAVGSYRDVFDERGRVIKVPLYEEYYFVCKNWLATDEADGLLERELPVKRKSVFFTERT